MCDCYGDMKNKLVEHLSAKMPEGSEKLDIEIQGYLFGVTVDNSITHRSSNAVKGSYMTPKKGGGMKRVSINTYIRASYCPFCGESYQKAEAESK
jgi:hypothetical protein